MPKAHPADLRARVLATAAARGVTVAAKEHGVGKATVSNWCRSEGIRTVPNEQTAAAIEAHSAKRAALREQIGTRLLQRALDMLERMGADSAANACQSYATASAILIDKSQLLSGGATSRHEHVEAIDVELRRLAEQVKANT